MFVKDWHSEFCVCKRRKFVDIYVQGPFWHLMQGNKYCWQVDSRVIVFIHTFVIGLVGLWRRSIFTWFLGAGVLKDYKRSRVWRRIKALI